MKCPTCDKVVPITKAVQSSGDAITCPYCYYVIKSEIMVWKDGEFHFNVIGDVKTIRVAPRILLKDQKAKTLDLKKILNTAKKIISAEPNIRCISAEFGISDEDIRIELLKE